jgi:hypothetical protein
MEEMGERGEGWRRWERRMRHLGSGMEGWGEGGTEGRGGSAGCRKSSPGRHGRSWKDGWGMQYLGYKVWMRGGGGGREGSGICGVGRRAGGTGMKRWRGGCCRQAVQCGEAWGELEGGMSDVECRM